jgi:hypothetical protein
MPHQHELVYGKWPYEKLHSCDICRTSGKTYTMRCPNPNCNYDECDKCFETSGSNGIGYNNYTKEKYENDLFNYNNYMQVEKATDKCIKEATTVAEAKDCWINFIHDTPRNGIKPTKIGDHLRFTPRSRIYEYKQKYLKYKQKYLELKNN